MDRRDAMAMSGFYMQSGMSVSGTQAGLNVSSGINPLPNTTLPFQPNIGPGPIGSTLSPEPSSGISPHGVGMSTPSAVPPTGEPVKRKRGRPRKYGADGSASLALSPSLSTHPGTITPTQKRGRGRPPGTGRKQQLASLGDQWVSGSTGVGFTPHIITIAVGEDIVTKIMSFSKQGPVSTCILSANGAVSNVTLRQPSTSGGIVTYEGHFEILCLSGSYLLSDNVGSRNRTGGLTVSLASPDGRVIGGGVEGMLLAASPVQVIVGSFFWGGGSKSKNKNKNKKEDAGSEAARESDLQTVENQVTTTSIPPSPDLATTSSGGIWPGSRSVDMHGSHVGIDLMRGL